MSTLPLTVDDWLAAAPATGGSWTAMWAAHARIANMATPEYLHVVSPATLQSRLWALETQAAGLDAATRRRTLPLYGVPFVVKDNIHIAGAPTTAACPAYARTAEHTAPAVQRLLDAGAVWLAKTNLDQFATGLVGTRSPYGAPASAFSAAHVSGGSSSGSAVAVARGDVPLALGTDTAGSGRVPAAFNHIVGLKPTPGRVSSAGVVPACRSIDCVSVFALTVDDAARALAVIEGPDAADIYSCYTAGPAALPEALRIGVPARLPSGPDGVEPAYAAAFEQACAAACALGATLVPIDFGPLDEVAALLYAGPWVAERWTVIGALLQRAPEAVDAAVRSVVSGATRYSAADAFQAQYRLRELAQVAGRVWQTCDVLLVPTAPGHPTRAQVAAEPLQANARLGAFTNFVNLLGWCALALPAGLTPAGMPFGVTFIGAAHHDAALAWMGRRFAALVQQPLGATGVQQTPGDTLPAPWPASETTLPLAVVGAHLAGLPLNGQLLERGARLRACTTTAPCYRLYALPGTTPAKPGLLRVAEGGQAIAVEVWDMPQAQLGSFLALVPSPLGLGSIELADGQQVHGFLCEAHALAQARDISHLGGWRAYLASL